MRPIFRGHALLALAAVLVLAETPAAPRPDARKGWVTVEYGSLVDRRKLSHSGESVGALLDSLGGRQMPSAGERPEDAVRYRLLDPLLEPYAFVLPDALDAMAPPPDPPMVDVGGLWEPGEAQPAWVELARSRRLLLESDGDGHLRAFLPVAAPEPDPETAAKQAWDDFWPVLRHALSGERRRLAARAGEPPALDVEVHAYRHLPALSRFELAVTPWRVTVREAGPIAGRPPLDLTALSSVLDRGLRIEGARLEPSGRVRWFTSEPDAKPTILGRGLSLADLAVAYRAVARGGYGEPYMSLDRAPAPFDADVNYGGRLRDTALGMVSLIADVRFKTFGLGLDLQGGGDVRELMRRTVPDFRTDLERFAAYPAPGAVLDHRMRFWFYPDDVDLTLSREGDVLAFRKVRMTAAWERVREAGDTTADPPWTRETVAALNAHYDEFAALFPELGDLDESVRLLSLFTWLEAARARGLAVPDLDVLLALELPALPTPRRFPQLLTHDVLPPPAKAGVVDVLDRTAVGDAFGRLEPAGGKPLAATRRFRRALSMLNRQATEQAALASEMEALRPDAGSDALDALSYRAERLILHARLLATVAPERRAAVEARRSSEPGTRVLIGVGGVDLGMKAVLARAAQRASTLGLTSESTRRADAPMPAAPRASAGPVTPEDPAGLPKSAWPDHGLGPASERTTVALPDGRGSIVGRRRPGSLVRKGTRRVESGNAVAWEESISGLEGPEARARRRIADPDGKPPVFERLEDGRFLGYRFDRQGDTLRAVQAVGSLPEPAFGRAAADTALPAPLPAGLTLLNVLPPADSGVAGELGDPPTVRVRVRGADGRDRSAAIPRTLLQRLVLGREVDPTPDRPLQAFTPVEQILGDGRVLMVAQSADETRAPWLGLIGQRPGEETAARIARALTRWWSADPASASARAVVGVDESASPRRWAAAARLDGGAVRVVAPEDAFPGPAARLRAGLSDLAPGSASARAVLVVSAEPPGVLGRRLRSMASDPAFAGKAIAVVALGGDCREDLPSSLLGDGRFAALGLFEAGPVGLTKAMEQVVAWVRASSGDAANGRRVEDVPGPFTWYY